jgi:hypothetical protein
MNMKYFRKLQLKPLHWAKKARWLALLCLLFPVTLSAQDLVKPSVTIVAQPTCTEPDKGEIKFTPAGGVPDYVVDLWKNGELIDEGVTVATGSDYSKSGLTAGNYKVVLDDTDPLIPAVETEFTIAAEEVPPLQVSGVVTAYPTCTDPTGGEAALTIAGGSGTYNILMPDGSTVQVTSAMMPLPVTGIAAGQYIVTISDALCPAVTPYIYSGTMELEDTAPLQVSGVITAYPTCTDPTGGAATLTIAGGSGTYNVLMSDGSTVQVTTAMMPLSVTGITAGQYIVTISDALCPAVTPYIYSGTMELENLTPLAVVVAQTNPTCTNDDGALEVAVSGGSGNYAYSWSNGATTESAGTDLAAGEYTVTITDIDCPAVAPVIKSYTLTAEAKEPLAVSTSVTDFPTCEEPTKGEITLSVSGGSGTYLVSCDAGTVNGLVISDLPAGTHTITVTDVDCPAVAPVVLTVEVVGENAEPLTVKPRVVSTPTCEKPTNGQITINITGGSVHPAYKISCDAGSVSNLGISNLRAGTHTITVWDDNCPAVAPVILTVEIVGEKTEPLAVKATVTDFPTCEEPTKGEITLIVSGGNINPVYEVTCDAGTVNWLTISDLPAGTHTITVRDANCHAVEPVILTVEVLGEETEPLRLSIVTQAAPTCANNDGEIEVIATGGSMNPAIKYKWSNGSTSASAGTDLAAGDYTVTVWDDNCPAVEPKTLTVTLPKDLNLLEIKVDEKIDPTCPRGTDGEIRISVIGGNVGDYSYEWTGPDGFTATTEDIAALKAGIYSVRVTASGDNNSCFAVVDNIELKDPFEWTSATLAKYVTLIGREFHYENGYNVPAIAILTNELPENAYVSWVANGDSIGILSGGDGEIPGFKAYNPIVGGIYQSTITVTVGSPKCPDNKATGTFVITVHSSTVEDLDLVMKPVAAQTVCTEEAFAQIVFESERTDGYPLADVTYTVVFVSGVDVLNGDNTLLGTQHGATWAIDLVNVANRLQGKGTYRVTPRSSNGQGMSVYFTLEVLSPPQVDAVPDRIFCNGSEFYQTFSSSRNAATMFDYEVRHDSNPAAGYHLNLVNGSTKIDVRLENKNSIPVTDTIIVIPHLSGSCPESGIRDTFLVTVLPTPKVKTLLDVVAANDSILAAVDLTGEMTDGSKSVATTFRWVTDNPAIASTQDEVNAISSGEGTVFPSFKVKNTTEQPTMATVTVIPVYEYNGYTCEGEAKSFFILVASKPAIFALEDVTVCEGERVQPIATSGLPAGAGYFITYEGGADVGLANYTVVNAASENYPSVRAVKGFTAQIDPYKLTEPSVRTITVTPYLYFNDKLFPGDKKQFNINVLPKTLPAEGYAKEVTESLEFCDGEEIYLDVVSAQGYNLTYQWYKDHIAIPGAYDAEYIISAADSRNIASGKYYCVVTGACGSYTSKTYDILIKPNIVIQRWDDVLAVNCVPETNGGYTFTEFQWYRGDGTLLFGETKSYLYVTDAYGFGNEYYVVAKTMKDGAPFDYVSCPKQIDRNALNNLAISLYPNPVKGGDYVTVQVSETAVLHLTDYSGTVLKTVTVGAGTSTVQMPNLPGVYIIQAVLQSAQNVKKEFKVIVK